MSISGLLDLQYFIHIQFVTCEGGAPAQPVASARRATASTFPIGRLFGVSAEPSRCLRGARAKTEEHPYLSL